MEELKQEMNAAYRLMGTIPVRGEMTEVMSEARRHLRTAYRLAEELEEKGEETNG